VSEASTTRRVLREPMLHFAVLAALIFAAHAAFGGAAPDDPPPRDPATIVLDEAFLDGLAERERLATGRAPDRDALERDWLREEILVRESERLGLGAHDPILRQRRVQLAELWLEASVDVPEPSDDELSAILRRDRARYAQPAQVSFTHVFFASRRGDPMADAAAARARMPVPYPAQLGDPFLLGASIRGRTRDALAGSFGEGFADAVFALEPETWSAPIESSYGAHLVFVNERTEPRDPPLDEVRDRVRADWIAERTEAETRAAFERLRARYVLERR